MKKHSFIIILLIFSLISCEKADHLNYENVTQKVFISFVESAQNLYFKNEIEQGEKQIEYDEALEIKLDSIKLFENWKGKITEITRNDENAYSKISFSLIPNHFNKETIDQIKFDCTYIVEIDKANNDSIYQTLKKISNYDEVYFDGFISRKTDKTINYSTHKYFSNRIVNNNFKFNILTISNIPIPEKSEVLKNSIDLLFNNMDYVEDYRLGKISKKEFRKRINSSKKTFENLPLKEKEYLSKLNQYLQIDYLTE